MAKFNKENLYAYVMGYMHDSIGEEDEYSQAIVSTCKNILRHISEMEVK